MLGSVSAVPVPSANSFVVPFRNFISIVPAPVSGLDGLMSAPLWWYPLVILYAYLGIHT